MARGRTKYACSECGQVSAQWVGQCAACKAWNTIEEELVESNPRLAKAGARGGSGGGGVAMIARKAEVRPLSDYVETSMRRLPTGDPEFDRVLGGGMVPGAVVLLGGEPGIGKSTLALQTAMRALGTILYVTGEESPEQVRMRADRLGTLEDRLLVLPETSTDAIIDAVREVKPALLIVDSVQTLHSSRVESTPGSITQVRESTAELLLAAKPLQLPVLLIGHITKDGSLAGPKVLEHMVDVVLTFEGDRHHAFRILRAQKNRFGSTHEAGIFEMQHNGLLPVANPSEVLLTGGVDGAASGTALAVAIEGGRPMMIEVQALVSTAVYGTPQRSSTGYELKRLHMLWAVLEKRCGFKIGASDVFLNIAGGLKINDPALDLSVVAAALGSSLDMAAAPKTAFAGEVGLTGEVRPVSRLEQRVGEAQRMGIERFVVSSLGRRKIKVPAGIKLIEVGRVADLQRVIF
jgi:DNA repair protein RadA/Sms